MPKSHRIPQVLLLVETSRAYGREILEGIGQYVKDHDSWLLHFEERGQDDPPPRWLKSWRGDGIISRTRSPDLARLLKKTRVPLVELHGDPSFGMPHVYTNDDAVAELAAAHFLERGLRNLAFFAIDGTWWIRRRGEAFAERLRARGLQCRTFPMLPRRTLQERRWLEADRRKITAWIHSLPQPAGVFCATDRYAALLLDVCRSAGIAVPEQIAVLGTNNDSVVCNLSQPPLSSVDQNPHRIGYEAAALLDRRIAGKPAPKTPILIDPVDVITRQSTEMLAIDDADVVQALRIIREQACRGLRVESIADTLALSRRTLERRFRSAMNRSMKEEMRRVQIARARLMLRDRTIPLLTAARRSGFTSLSYFVKVFLQETGATPGQFRRQG